MRAVLALTMGGLLLAACAAPAPYSDPNYGGAADGFGGFTSYELERAQREAALTGAPTGGFAAPAAVAAAPIGAIAPAPPPVPGGISTSELAAAGIGVDPAAATFPPATTLPAPAAPPADATLGTPLGVSTAAPSAVALGATAGATPVPVLPPATAALTPTVAAAAPLPEWSSDADPLRTSGLEASPANAAPTLVGVDGTLPTAPATTGPNIVQYALSAPNSVGQEAYSRFVFSGESRAARNCADYASPDEAQRDFLARGGPERDARGLDPDGDGFACSWDPAPFRAAVGR